MNWILFIIIAYVFLVLQASLHSFLMIGGASPDLLLILLVFMGLSAPPRVLGWSALVLGIITDLQAGPLTAPIIGPATLGYLAGGYVILQIRSLVFKESLITFVAMVFIIGIAISLITVFMYTLRGLPWPLSEPVANWSAAAALLHRFFVVLYTTVVSVPIGWALVSMSSWFNFASPGHSDRRF